MSWKLIPKRYEYLEEGKVKISNSCVRFSFDLKPTFQNFKNCNIYIDSEKGLIKFEGTNDNKTGFRFTDSKYVATTRKLLNVIPEGIFNGRMEKDCVIINYKEDKKGLKTK